RARTRRVTGPSTDAARGSTFEFTVPAAELSGPAELQVALTEADESLPGSGSPDRTTFDSAVDLPGGLPIEAGRDIDIVIVPFRYQADESGREPDLSQPRLDDLRATLESIWPVRNVNLTVLPAIDWEQAILRDGSGFGEALEEIEGLRQNAAVPSSTYYYGMFDPADSFGGFCQSSCVTGLSYVPEATSAPQYRSSVGIGFTTSGTITADTMAHEVGHALGRSHAPCGNPDGVDGNFPYADGSIGAWGYDRESDTLFDPVNRFDMMSYCNPVWISDHNFDAIYERIRALSTSPFAPSRLVTALRVDGDDHVKSLDEARVFGSAAGMGARVVVQLVDELGQAQGYRDGWRVRLSHLPGGVVLLDEALPPGWTARIP
ncbi:MAG: M66 family metalloprotease, partial [Myxococcota bacterium]